MVKKVYMVNNDGKFNLFWTPDIVNPRLTAIEESAKALEQAVPFPCIKEETVIHQIRRGEDRDKFMVSMLVTPKGEIDHDGVIRHLGGAGFKYWLKLHK